MTVATFLPNGGEERQTQEAGGEADALDLADQEGLREGAPAAPGRAAPARGVDPTQEPARGRPFRRSRHGRQGGRQQADDGAAQPTLRPRGGTSSSDREGTFAMVFPALHRASTLRRRAGAVRQELEQPSRRRDR